MSEQKFKWRVSKFSGHPTFSIWKQDDNWSDGSSDRPIVSFGMRKAKAIVECFRDVMLFTLGSHQEGATGMGGIVPEKKESDEKA